MEKLLSEFIEFLCDYNLPPAKASDIKPDDKRHDFQLAHDAPTKKKGFYKLRIDGDFAYGFAGDYRGGECHSWHSKSISKLTPEEKARFREKVERERLQAQEEQKKIWDAKAVQAQEYVSKLPEAFAHAYLDKKGLNDTYGLFISDDGKLIVPMKNEHGEIRNYQSINESGEKRFLAAAQKQGNFFDIPGTNPICIVEGMATGASIHDATGYYVRVAFDAGNMGIVSIKTRAQYPDAEIIICADNDHESASGNTGIKKGKIAAKEINAKFIFPEFTENDKGLSDFNDMAMDRGLISVKERIHEACLMPVGGVAAGSDTYPVSVDLQPSGGASFDDGWRNLLMLNARGGMEVRSITNLSIIMANAPELRGVFKYDSFAKRIIVFKCPPWEDEQAFSVRSVADYDYFRLESYLERGYGLKASKDKVVDSIVSVAQLPENTFNPATDYFTALEWDGTPRLDTWMEKYVSDGQQSKEYLRIVSRKFLCGLAARAMNPGVKFDTMIILEGAQYAGKSYLSKLISTVNGTDYFLDDFKDIENKDTLMKMQGKLVVEFAEISTMRKAEVNDLKAFLSRTHDVFRVPYGRNTMESPRQCVFIGTTNPEGYYLRDVTGNRRYWPVSCRSKFDLTALKDIIPHLHAEAAHLVREGEQLWLNEEEYGLAAIEQEKRVAPDMWIDKISDIVAGKDQITTDQLMMELNVDMDKRGPQVGTRVQQTMISLGWSPARLVYGSRRPRGYKKNEEIIFFCLAHSGL